MARLQQSFKSQSGEYNFAQSGGVIGTFLMGVFLPENAIVYSFTANAIVAPNSGGAATISYGFIDNIAVVTNLVAYMVANAFGAFVVNVPVQGVNLFANPIKQVNPTEVVMAIGTANLTAGRLYFDIIYTEHDL